MTEESEDASVCAKMFDKLPAFNPPDNRSAGAVALHKARMVVSLPPPNVVGPPEPPLPEAQGRLPALGATTRARSRAFAAAT